MIATIHLAGPPQLSGLYQACVRCGHVLQDYTGRQVMVPEGQDPTLAVWPEGHRIAISGNATWTVANDAPLTNGETECKAAQ
ncbi:hypothetical protein SAMN05216275_14141 [Streptosporangium canum]|uniref:Uncharacterized protein n=1 Tax=Streptosporangium canum TaxID=324952 RepID=A0A1I4DFD1_9ACTN|nr:hypothetical protein [Streptosporangium canum]SFK92182.1 hypothetical protein SAMN05216275_14141 [Streptosporangium canum]